MSPHGQLAWTSDPKSDLPETKTTTAASNVMEKPTGSIRCPSLTSRPSISGLQAATTASKPPMRVLAPPSKHPLSNTTTQHTGVVWLSACQSSTIGSLPKSVVAMTMTIGKFADGPCRVLLQASNKPTPWMVSMPVLPVPKTQSPQRVLTWTMSATANPVKKPLCSSSSINLPAPTSQLPGPSCIAISSTLKTMRASSVSKPAG